MIKVAQIKKNKLRPEKSYKERESNGEEKERKRGKKLGSLGCRVYESTNDSSVHKCFRERTVNECKLRTRHWQAYKQTQQYIEWCKKSARRQVNTASPSESLKGRERERAMQLSTQVRQRERFKLPSVCSPLYFSHRE